MNYMPLLLVTILLLVVATGIIMLVLIYQKKQLQYLNEKEKMKVMFEKEILESRLEMQEQTMKNISQEVHDNIGQVLSVVKLNMNRMNCDEAKPILQEKINNTAQLVGKVIQDLRDLSKSLHSDVISEKGLVKAVEHELDILKKTGAYTTTLTVEGEPYTLPDEKELIVFRMFQEAINNIIKHAAASFIDVKIGFHPNQFLLSIHDNGQGFDATDANKNNGLGIRNIKNRSRLIGAGYTINSEPGKGTSIIIQLPVAQSLIQN